MPPTSAAGPTLSSASPTTRWSNPRSIPRSCSRASTTSAATSGEPSSATTRRRRAALGKTMSPPEPGSTPGRGRSGRRARTAARRRESARVARRPRRSARRRARRSRADGDGRRSPITSSAWSRPSSSSSVFGSSLARRRAARPCPRSTCRRRSGTARSSGRALRPPGSRSPPERCPCRRCGCRRGREVVMGERRGEDLGRRGGIAVDEDDERHRVDRVTDGVVVAVALGAASRADDAALLDEDRRGEDRLVQSPPPLPRRSMMIPSAPGAQAARPRSRSSPWAPSLKVEKIT